MLSQYIVGAQRGNVGDIKIGRVGRNMDQVASEYMPRYSLPTLEGKSFYVASQAGVVTTVGLATTYTGLVISNPIASTVNAILTKASFAQNVIQATTVGMYAIATGYNGGTNVTHSVAGVTHNCLVGNGTVAQVLVDTGATLPTAPFYTMIIQSTQTSSLDPVGGVVDLEGSIILPPGGYALWVTPAVSPAAAMFFGFQWIEEPI